MMYTSEVPTKRIFIPVPTLGKLPTMSSKLQHYLFSIWNQILAALTKEHAKKERASAITFKGNDP